MYEESCISFYSPQSLTQTVVLTSHDMGVAGGGGVHGGGGGSGGADGGGGGGIVCGTARCGASL